MKSLKDIPIEAGLSCSCDLAELKQAVPLDSLTLAGMLSLEVKVNGN